MMDSFRFKNFQSKSKQIILIFSSSQFLRPTLQSNLIRYGFLGLGIYLMIWMLPVYAETDLQQVPIVQVFDEAWQRIDAEFYDPHFNGVDWKKMREIYRPQVERATTRAEGYEIINQMISQLKASHTHLYTPDQPAYYQLAAIFGKRVSGYSQAFGDREVRYTDIGILTVTTPRGIFVKGVLEGSPAQEAGIRVGDQILEVDGKPFEPIASFRDKAGQPVRILIQTAACKNESSDEPRTDPCIRPSPEEITVIPKEVDPNQMFLEAEKKSIRIFEEEGVKIGYIHIWSYAREVYQDAFVEAIVTGEFAKASALIVDLRDGWGGASPEYLNVFNKNVPVMTTASRSGDKRKYDPQWRKPVVFLVNEGTRSGKEMLTYGFKKYRLGKVIGTPTAGAVLAGKPFYLSDGSLLMVAIRDVWVDGERLEGKGVQPDIYVDFPVEYARGYDPQRAKALKVLAEEVKQSKQES
jgi:carboxyl-terminal processing protease